MIYIKMKVDDQATFTNFLDTFQNLPSVELAEPYKDLIMGTILHSDIKALIVRIQSNKSFNLTNLGENFSSIFSNLLRLTYGKNIVTKWLYERSNTISHLNTRKGTKNKICISE